MATGRHNLAPAASQEPPPTGRPGERRPAPITRRIVTSILMVVWTALLGAGACVYVLTRTVLMDNFDETILARVASLPELERPSAIPELERRRAGEPPEFADRYVLQFPGGRRLSSTTTRPSSDEGAPRLEVLRREFTSAANGVSFRTLTVRAPARRETPGSPLVPVTVVYSAPAEDLERALNNLLFALGGFGLMMAVGAVFSARAAARAALAPLQETSNVIGGIDERSLDRRIAVERLPAELTAVGTRLNDMLGRLETAFVQRKQFLADASHELRTPVAGLVTTLEVALRRRRESDEYVRALETCLSDARLLHQLVTALLDQVRSQRFAAELELAPVRVTSVLKQCATLAATLGSAKGVAVEHELPEGMLLLTDEMKLRSIVTNLLSNAVEYTPGNDGKGRVRLVAELLPAGEEGAEGKVSPALEQALAELGAGVTAARRRLVVRVIDNGPGIPAEHLPNLFEPFYRADQARTNPEHHLGLGLAIVRDAARALGGECRVQSPAPGTGAGCEFTVEIPAPALEQRPETSVMEPRQRGSKPLQQEHV